METSVTAQRPEGSVEVCRVEVIQYIDPDSGGLFWNLDWTEDASLTQIIGLLQIGSAEILRRVDRED